MSPLVGRYRPSSSRPKVVLPEPVSPTRARVSPRRMASETPSIAFSVARPARVRPTEKYLETSRVSMIGGSAWLSVVMAPPPLSTVTAPPGVGGQRVAAGVRPAVDLQDRAGDVGGRVRGQEEHGLGDIARITGPAERNGPDQGGPQLIGRPVRIRVAPFAYVDVAGGDDVHPDPVRAKLHGKDLAHRFDCRLGCTVGRAARPRVPRGSGRDVDHGRARLTITRRGRGRGRGRVADAVPGECLHH